MAARTHISIELSLHHPLKVAAAQDGISIQKFVGRLIRAELEHRENEAQGRTIRSQ